MGAAIVKLPIAIFTSPMFAKNLSASEFAAIGYFNTLSTFLMPVIALMFYNYYMTGYHERNDKENGSILQSLVSFLLLLDVFIVAIAFFILKWYLSSSGSGFNAYPLGLITFTTAMFNMGVGFWGIKLRFERKSVKYFILQTAMMMFSTGLGLLLVVYFKMGATGRLLPNMIFSIGIFIIFFYVIIKKFKIDFKIVKHAWLFCYPLILSGLLALPIMYLDKILLERIHNNAEFGLYNIAGTIAGYFGMTTAALFQAFQPDIFKNVDTRSKKPLLQIFAVLVVLFILGGFLFSIIAPYAVDYLTAGRYLGATKYIILFVVIAALQPITYFLTYVIIALKLTKLELFNQIIMAILSLVVYYLFILRYQYFGALYAKISIMLMLILIVLLEILARKSSFINRFKVKSI